MFVYGSDTYRREACTTELIDGYQKKRDTSGMSVRICSSGDTTIDEIATLVRNTGLFTQKQCIVVHDLINTLKKSTPIKPLEDLIASTLSSEHTILILVERVDSWLAHLQPIITTLKARSHCFDCTPLTEKTFSSWVTSYTSAHHPNTSITTEAAKSLGSMTAYDATAASNIISQCIAITSGTITADTLREFLTQTHAVSPFQAIDAWIQGNHAQFQKLIAHADIDETWKFGYTSALLTTLACATLLNKKISTQHTAQILQVKEFQVKKSLPLAKRLSMQAIRHAHTCVLEADYGMKHGDAHAWERIILTLIQI